MDDRLTRIVARARERFPELADATEELGEVSLDVRRDALVAVAMHVRDSAPFELLADWSCIDWLGVVEPARRFCLSAHLASVQHPARLRLRVWIADGDETCPTLVPVWPGAEFQEREMFDFFGVTFEGHPDLRRIFMPDEWEGHPQRKDYPLGGSPTFYHGSFIPPPDTRGQPATTTGYPGRLS